MFIRVSEHGMFVMSAVGPAKSADFSPIARKRLSSFVRKDPFLNDCVLEAAPGFIPHLAAKTHIFNE